MPWNCGSLVKTRDADETSHQIVARERDARGREIVHVDEIADGLADAAQAHLVRAAARRRDAVDVAAHVLVGGLSQRITVSSRMLTRRARA